MTNFFLENVYIMGYNLKNARNGKCVSNIPKWPSLSPLELKSKFIQQFEFLENLEDFFHTNLLTVLNIQTAINSHSLIMGASNLAILIFSAYFFHFWHS